MNLNRRQTLHVGSAALAALHPLAGMAQAPAPCVMASFSGPADMARALAPAGIEVGPLVCPNADVHVYVPHDAFDYFGAAYGLDFVTPQGWTTHSVPSAAAVSRLIRHIQQGQVRAAFVENISDPRLAQRHEA